ncbi:MAG: HAD family hydrolase [Anaerosomatales bacterium]|nr:HAD family hydrolase [Anaerosomatales bacterium]
MIEVDIPGRGVVRLRHLVLDVNGTIACDGVLIPGVVAALEELRGVLSVVAVTADTHGTARALEAATGVEVRTIEPGEEAEQKLRLVEELGSEEVVAIGNGANDAGMLQAAALGVCVIGLEGAATHAMLVSDVVVTSIVDALDLLRAPRRLVATLRR